MRHIVIKSLSQIILFVLLLIFFYISEQIIFRNYFEQNILYQKIEEINKWIYLCQNKILIRDISDSVPKPKITALITLYNSQNYIHTAIKSIQNQVFSDIEILIVDDGSNDNSSYIIRDLQKEDKRIKIIHNKKNRGALFAKSIGIIKAIGDYTIILDSDDLFANENIFNICFNEALKNNIDIIEFSGYNLNSSYFSLDIFPEIPYYLRFKKENQYIYQPDLSFFIYQKKGENNYKLIDGVLWGKFIKSCIFKMSVNIVGYNVYKQKINYGDDRLVNFILFKVAKSFKFIHEYGIIYHFNNNSITHLNTHIDNCHDELINIISIYNYTKNSKEIEIAVFEIIFRWNHILFPGMNTYNFNILINLLKKLLINNYVCYSNKLRLLYFYHNLTESKKFNLFYSS